MTPFFTAITSCTQTQNTRAYQIPLARLCLVLGAPRARLERLPNEILRDIVSASTGLEVPREGFRIVLCDAHAILEFCPDLIACVCRGEVWDAKK